MTERERRVVWFGATVALGALVLLRGVPAAVRAGFRAEHALMQRAAFVAHARAELAQGQALLDWGPEVTQALSRLAPKILDGNTPAAAAADLGGRLNLLVAQHHGKLERTEELADSASAGRLRRVRLHIAVESDIAGLAGMLGALAGGDAALSVQEVRIVALDAGPGTSGPEVLKGDLTITGWYVGGGPPPAPSQEGGQ